MCVCVCVCVCVCDAWGGWQAIWIVGPTDEQLEIPPEGLCLSIPAPRKVMSLCPLGISSREPNGTLLYVVRKDQTSYLYV